MSEENVLVKVRMSKEALENIKTLKDEMNASTESEVIRDAISLLIAVEKARNTSGNVVIPSKSAIPGRVKEINLPWD
jgi:Arc/MetJ-type ribon-helix-helix transcriptional regulator